MTNINLDEIRLAPEQVQAITPRKIKKRREQFVKVPWTWVERLSDAPGQTWHMAAHVLHRAWKNRGKEFTLANGMLKLDGIGRTTKWRALLDLEGRGLIVIERRPRRSPAIRMTACSVDGASPCSVDGA